MTTGDPRYKQVRKRHANIRQDAMFDVDPEDAGTPRGKPESERSIRTAECPQCRRSNKKVGVIRRNGIDVFRDHDKFTVGGGRIPCSGSGQEAPPS